MNYGRREERRKKERKKKGKLDGKRNALNERDDGMLHRKGRIKEK